MGNTTSKGIVSHPGLNNFLSQQKVPKGTINCLYSLAPTCCKKENINKYRTPLTPDVPVCKSGGRGDFDQTMTIMIFSDISVGILRNNSKCTCLRV